jgi:hypothetical protein
MDTTTLTDINLYDIGTRYQIAGALWASADDCLLTLLPDKEEGIAQMRLLPMTLAEWEVFLRQTDLLETEILLTDASGTLSKAILRKSQRQIDMHMQWAVFKRDNYTCRYCGRDGVPLSVDHILLWERGGPTIPENLLTACRKCNKDRGSTEYPDWLASPHYQKRAVHLTEAVRQANQAVLERLPALWEKRVMHIRSR